MGRKLLIIFAIFAVVLASKAYAISCSDSHVICETLCRYGNVYGMWCNNKCVDFLYCGTKGLVYCCPDDGISSAKCCPYGYICGKSSCEAPPPPPCTDTDGENIKVRGTATEGSTTRTDTCVDGNNKEVTYSGRLKEYYCSPNLVSKDVYCICSDGACTTEPSQTPLTEDDFPNGCCNEIDDDEDGMENSLDDDCKTDTNLVTGTNKVCWATEWNPYKDQFFYTSGLFSCPFGNKVTTVGTIIETYQGDDFYIFDANIKELYRTSGIWGRKIIDDVGAYYNTQKIKFVLRTNNDGMGGAGVMVDSITCVTTSLEPCTYSLTIAPKGDAFPGTSNTWTVSASDSSSGGCPSPIKYSIVYEKTPGCFVNIPPEFTVNQWEKASFSISAGAEKNGYCKVTLDIKAPDGKIVDPAIFTVQPAATGPVFPPKDVYFIAKSASYLDWHYEKPFYNKLVQEFGVERVGWAAASDVDKINSGNAKVIVLSTLISSTP